MNMCAEPCTTGDPGLCGVREMVQALSLLLGSKLVSMPWDGCPAACHQPSPAPDFCWLAKASGAAPRIDFSWRALRQIPSHPAVHHALPPQNWITESAACVLPLAGTSLVCWRGDRQARPWYSHSTMEVVALFPE